MTTRQQLISFSIGYICCIFSSYTAAIELPDNLLFTLLLLHIFPHKQQTIQQPDNLFYKLHLLHIFPIHNNNNPATRVPFLYVASVAYFPMHNNNIPATGTTIPVGCTYRRHIYRERSSLRWRTITQIGRIPKHQWTSSIFLE